jgi:hypothetical protein
VLKEVMAPANGKTLTLRSKEGRRLRHGQDGATPRQGKWSLSRSCIYTRFVLTTSHYFVLIHNWQSRRIIWKKRRGGSNKS